MPKRGWRFDDHERAGRAPVDERGPDSSGHENRDARPHDDSDHSRRERGVDRVVGGGDGSAGGWSFEVAADQSGSLHLVFTGTGPGNQTVGAYVRVGPDGFVSPSEPIRNPHSELGRAFRSGSTWWPAPTR